MTKPVYGSDTTYFCGDTVTFTVQDFQCDLNFSHQNYTLSDTVKINTQFGVNYFQHMTKLYLHVLDMNDNLLASELAYFNGSSQFYKQIPKHLYYNNAFKVTYSMVYNPGDSIAGCDTAVFVVEDFKCDFGYHVGRCVDTVQSTYDIWVGNWHHYDKVYMSLYDDNDNLIVTEQMVGNHTRIFDLDGHVSDGNDYYVIPHVTYKNPYNSNDSTIVQNCGDTCFFHVAPTGLVRVRGNELINEYSHRLTGSNYLSESYQWYIEY